MRVFQNVFNGRIGFGPITIEMREGRCLISWPGITDYLVVMEGHPVAIEVGQISSSAADVAIQVSCDRIPAQ